LLKTLFVTVVHLLLPIADTVYYA